jgi:hypothetical protein
MTTSTKIILRNDTATNLTNTNPVLSKGEVCIENDTGKQKIGNGVDPWNTLPYQGASILDDLNDISITTPTEGDALVYDVISELWVNKPLQISTVVTNDDIINASPNTRYILSSDATQTVVLPIGVDLDSVEIISGGGSKDVRVSGSQQFLDGNAYGALSSTGESWKLICVNDTWYLN